MERHTSHNCDRSSKVNSRVGRLPGKVSPTWESGKASWKGCVEGPDSIMIIISPHLVEFKGLVDGCTVVVVEPKALLDVCSRRM